MNLKLKKLLKQINQLRQIFRRRLNIIFLILEKLLEIILMIVEKLDYGVYLEIHIIHLNIMFNCINIYHLVTMEFAINLMKTQRII